MHDDRLGRRGGQFHQPPPLLNALQVEADYLRAGIVQQIGQIIYLVQVGLVAHTDDLVGPQPGLTEYVQVSDRDPAALRQHRDRAQLDCLSFEGSKGQAQFVFHIDHADAVRAYETHVPAACHLADLFFQPASRLREFAKAARLDHCPADAFPPAPVQQARHRLRRSQDHGQVHPIGQRFHRREDGDALHRTGPQPDGIDVAAVAKPQHIADDAGCQIIGPLRSADDYDAMRIKDFVHRFASRRDGTDCNRERAECN